MKSLVFDKLYNKLFRHAKILGFTKTSVGGIKCYCYIEANNEFLNYNEDFSVVLKHFYDKLFKAIDIEMVEFRHGISR